MEDYGKELASLDFGNLIGGPLSAVVNAQALAARSTVEFIQNVGLTEDGSPRYVKFKYPKETKPATAEEEAKVQMMEMEVPLLTIVPIPFIRIEEATINFNAKINSVAKKEERKDMNIGVEAKFKQKWPGGSIRLNASFSYKKSNKSSSRTERTYTMGVQVKAVQDEMPSGMEKILNILEMAMIERKSTESVTE